MLNVFMHPCTFWFGRYSGIARYVCELIAHLREEGVKVHLPIKNTYCEYLKEASFFPETSAEAPGVPWYAAAVEKICSFGSIALAEKGHRFALRQEIRRYMAKEHHFDVIHPTHVSAYDLLPHIGNTPLVTTVHDMTHELFPDSFPQWDPTAVRKQEYSRLSDRIIAISECTKKDLVEICGIEPERVDVVHHGNSLILPADAATRPMDLPENYVLFVGKRPGYKNFDIFLHAFAEIAAQERELHLICAGGGAFSPAELELADKLHLRGRVQQRWVTDEELAILYNRCAVFVYPSAYEGFGLPLLEAFACGAPVLCANASCFPEIAANGADYFPADDAAAMVTCMQRVLGSSGYAQNLRARGAERLTHFSWQRCAQETLQTYKKAIAQKHP